MTLRKKLLPTFNNPVTGQTATVNLTLGQKLYTIWLTIGDDDGHSIVGITKEIRVLINGKVQRRMTGDELNQINSINGLVYAAQIDQIPPVTGPVRNHLPIYLAEPWRKTNIEAAALGWNLAGPNVTSASIEVDLLAGLTAPVISGWYEWSPPDGGLGAITKWIRQTLGASGTVQDFTSFTRGDFYHAFHLFAPTGAYVNKVRLTADGVVIHDVIDLYQNNALLTNRGLAGGTDRYDLILDADDPINSALNTQGVQELELHVEYSAPASGNLVVLVEKSGPPE